MWKPNNVIILVAPLRRYCGYFKKSVNVLDYLKKYDTKSSWQFKEVCENISSRNFKVVWQLINLCINYCVVLQWS